jgi:hypothetical protein
MRDKSVGAFLQFGEAFLEISGSKFCRSHALDVSKGHSFQWKEASFTKGEVFRHRVEPSFSNDEARGEMWEVCEQ